MLLFVFALWYGEATQVKLDIFNTQQDFYTFYTNLGADIVLF